ncbi:MAG: glycosyltransferase family 1 protein [Janthinobacterium sp.]
MNRFAQMLDHGYKELNIETEIWSPPVVFSKWSASTITGVGKWLGYLDKWIIYPINLKLRLLNKKYRATDIRFHICDHSNSMYLKYLPLDRTVITCHDVLAIRGALGDKDAYCPATKTGKVLQNWILTNLCTAKFLATVSKFTLNQLLEIKPSNGISTDNWKVIHNGFNENFWKMDSNQSDSLVEKAGVDPRQPYILHVGSNLPRKNRRLLIDMVASLGDKYNGNICFAGQAIEEDLLNHAASLGLKDRLITVYKPDHITLVALYCNSDAFIFPSLSEGFGWPVIEAQACGTPVITSNKQPFIEVGGSGALYSDPESPEEFANSFLKLKDIAFRENLINAGFNNCSKFTTKNMINSYATLHSSELRQ